ncbi:hypothetical protein KUTeg_012197 [Tegillarca granosa]|uniref:Uncharacterized protein n=1 Tax=Tegillarca granosa TaxID=220873 RepID=A0ABQ9F364_TEGGR|nr:hypothetical protein KUTeg_012197 [Tegillarca granosa]
MILSDNMWYSDEAHEDCQQAIMFKWFCGTVINAYSQSARLNAVAFSLDIKQVEHHNRLESTSVKQ